MKGEQNVSFSIDGTSALKINHCQQRTRTATIIDFPGRQQRKGNERGCRPVSVGPLDAAKLKLLGILESSEMYCSLKFEDLRGFQYNRFNNLGIAMLSSATAFIAIVSIVAGA